MRYTILETHQEFKNGKLDKIAVLWVSNPDSNWVRGSFFTREVQYGYGYLQDKHELNNQLLQEVAGCGPNLPDQLKAKYFPGDWKWER